MVEHAFNPSILESDTGGSLSSRPALSIEQVPGQSRLHSEALSLKPKQNKIKKKYEYLGISLTNYVPTEPYRILLRKSKNLCTQGGILYP